METLAALLGGALLFFLLFSILVFLAMYVFLSLTFSSMGKKANLNHPNLAWVPGFGPFIVAFQASGMSWWPWLLLIAYIPIFIEILAIQIISAIALIVFFIYSIVWDWKLLKSINKPGWWAILFLIPIINFIFMGIAAWSK